MEEVSNIQNEVETRLKSTEPDVEVLLAERVAAERVRVVVDHPKRDFGSRAP